MLASTRTRRASAAAVAAFAGAATLVLSASPAAAAGPGSQSAYYYDTNGVHLGAATVNQKSTDHYDIAVADKVMGDGNRVCLLIQADDGPGTPPREIKYCDDNGTTAATHYNIYYDWQSCFLLVGRGGTTCN